MLVIVAVYAKSISLVSSLAIIGAVIGCGVFLLLIACMGFIGAVKHHQICLFFYMVILFLLFLIQFSLAIALLAMTKNNQEDLIKAGWDQVSTETKNDAMKSFECCDLMSWKPSDDLTCPASLECCKGEHSMAKCCGGTDKDVECSCDPCFNTLTKMSDQACKITGAVGLVISFSEIIGVWLSLRFRNQKDPRADPNAFLWEQFPVNLLTSYNWCLQVPESHHCFTSSSINIYAAIDPSRCNLCGDDQATKIYPCLWWICWSCYSSSKLVSCLVTPHSERFHWCFLPHTEALDSCISHIGILCLMFSVVWLTSGLSSLAWAFPKTNQGIVSLNVPEFYFCFVLYAIILQREILRDKVIDW